MKKEFEEIKHIMEDHLSSINENASEIQALFDYIHEMEVKVEKLSQRLEQVQLSPPEKISVITLNHLEKKVFLAFYTEEMPLSFHDLSEKAELPISVVPDCVSSLIKKKIPLQRSCRNNQIFFKLDPLFKELQAKENVVNLSLQSFLG